MRAPVRILRVESRGGRRAVAQLLARGDELADPRVERAVRAIVDGVRRGGDRALLAAVARHDGVRVRQVAELRCDLSTMKSTGALPVGFVEGLERAIAAVERYHRPQLREGYVLEGEGVWVAERRIPLRRVGIYIPGGRASYPSTAVMTVIPARLAGVTEIAVATPPAALQRSPALAYTLDRLGVDEVWSMGGAQAVAAFAWGTETIARVDKVLGPGGVWATAAKRMVAGKVSVDRVAGPTEVVVLATAGADPEWVAADLLAQAEHDPRAHAVLLTPDKALARAVVAELSCQLAALPDPEPARSALGTHGVALVVDGVEAGLALADAIAPEHLHLVGAAAEALAERPVAAAAVFVGGHTPEVFGDYLAGPSHVLPTGGSARCASGLGVDDFVRRVRLVRCAPGSASRWAAAAVAIAEAEGLPAHVAAALKRLR